MRDNLDFRDRIKEACEETEFSRASWYDHSSLTRPMVSEYSSNTTSLTNETEGKPKLKERLLSVFSGAFEKLANRSFLSNSEEPMEITDIKDLNSESSADIDFSEMEK